MNGIIAATLMVWAVAFAPTMSEDRVSVSSPTWEHVVPAPEGETPTAASSIRDAVLSEYQNQPHWNCRSNRGPHHPYCDGNRWALGNAAFAHEVEI